MREVVEAKPTPWDRVRGFFSADYAARASVGRYVAARPYMAFGGKRGSDTRTATGWGDQPFGPEGHRTLSPTVRRGMVRRSRGIDEHNILGSSLLDREVDNVIGHGLILQATTSDRGFNKDVQAFWENYGSEIDSRGRLKSHGQWQRSFYRSHRRDGDIGGMLLREGSVQAVETDYIRSPNGDGDVFESRDARPSIVEGVELNAAGRAVRYHVATDALAFRPRTRPVPARNFLFLSANERLDRTAVRGTPTLAMLGDLLDQVGATNEAIIVALRMAASFGLIHKRANPAALYSALPSTATNADGNEQPELLIEPGMVRFARPEDDIVQVRPEHPNTAFSEFMTSLIRLAGLKFGLPLELALMDFSKTNYSSARASMEQAYRRFRIQQRMFADCVLSRIYRWRVSKWKKSGELKVPASIEDEYWNHRWFGHPWPYLDPQKEAEGMLVAIDAGGALLSEELAKRGLQFEEWIERRSEEIKAIQDAGIPLVMSNKTREAGADAPAGDGDREDEDNE